MDRWASARKRQCPEAQWREPRTARLFTHSVVDDRTSGLPVPGEACAFVRGRVESSDRITDSARIEPMIASDAAIGNLPPNQASRKTIFTPTKASTAARP